jgi:hypothetical protein
LFLTIFRTQKEIERKKEIVETCNNELIQLFGSLESIIGGNAEENISGN